MIMEEMMNKIAIIIGIGCLLVIMVMMFSCSKECDCCNDKPKSEVSKPNPPHYHPYYYN